MNTVLIILAVWLILLALFVAFCFQRRAQIQVAQDEAESHADYARQLYADAGLNWYPIGNGEWRRVI